MRLTRFAAGARRLLWLLPLIPFIAGCSSSPWSKRVLYSRSGAVLYVEYEENEGGVVPKGYAHPVDVSTDTLEAILSQIVYKHRPLIGKNEDLLLFDKADVEQLVRPMQLALGSLTPDQRLRFLLMKDSWASVLTGPKGTSGVIFAENEGVLQIALGGIRESVEIGEGGDPSDVQFPLEPTEVRDADPLIPFRGTRLHVDEASGRKCPRWLEVTLAEVEAPPVAPDATTFATPEAVVTPEATAGPARNDVPEKTEAGAPAPPTPGETEDERYTRIKERLEVLGRLKADGVLTEEQYQQQFEKIMSEL